MNIEREVRILEINKEKLEHKLIEIGAYKEGEYFQKILNLKKRING